MAKKLIPQNVTNIGVHKRVTNNIRGVSEFTQDNNIVDIDVITTVLDMKNKIVIKSRLLYDDLSEGDTYDLLIIQNMKDFDTLKPESQQRKRLDMRLTKIEIPSVANGEWDEITYVFEKCSKENKVTAKYNELVSQRDAIHELFELVLAEAKSRGRFDKSKFDDGSTFK